MGFKGFERLGGPGNHAEGRGAARRCDREPSPFIARDFTSYTVLEMRPQALHALPSRSAILTPNHITPGDNRGGTRP